MEYDPNEPNIIPDLSDCITPNPQDTIILLPGQKVECVVCEPPCAGKAIAIAGNGETILIGHAGNLNAHLIYWETGECAGEAWYEEIESLKVVG